MSNCPSEANPEDFGSRGLFVFELKQCRFRWKVPTWLEGTEGNWQKDRPIVPTSESNEDQKKAVVMATQV